MNLLALTTQQAGGLFFIVCALIALAFIAGRKLR